MNSNVSDVTDVSNVIPPTAPTSSSDAKVRGGAGSPASKTKVAAGKYSPDKTAENTTRAYRSSDTSSSSIHTAQPRQSDIKTPDSAAVSSNDAEPVTLSKLRESLDIFRYEMHKELQVIIREQVRQFAIAKVCFFKILR